MELLSIELASWATAWEHEARGYHGKWIKAGEGLDRYTVPDHNRLKLTDPQAVANKRSLIDPADHPWFKAHPVSPANIIASYDASTPQERAQGARWYADAHLIADKITGGNPTEGAILLASYSPQSSWPVNMFNAARSAQEHRAMGKHDGMITGAMQANAQEGLDGKTVDEAMTSPKTRAFARLIELGGDSPTDGAGEVVIDRHALNVAAGATFGKDVTEKLPLGNPRVHEYIADQYRQAALDLSHRDGKVIPPYELQAITWLHQQAKAQAMDEAANAATVARGGRNLAKGRVTALRNAWARWMQYAQAQGIPLDSGVTALALQIEELMSIDLAAWEHELRGPDGRWISGGAGTIERVTHPIGDEGARGNSRAVSHDEFQQMAAEGRDRLRAIQGSPWSTSGLRGNWPAVKERTYAEVQKSWGGATVDPRTGQDLPQGADKFAMSVKPSGMDTTSIPEHASAAEFGQAMDVALAKYGGQLAKGGSYLGIFHDDDLHRIDIDPVTVLDSLREVETIGAWTHAIGGAYRFSDGNGYWPPHVPGSAGMANESSHHWEGPGQWHSQAVAVQSPHDEPVNGDTQLSGSLSGQVDLAHDAWRHELRRPKGTPGAGQWTRDPGSLAGQLNTGKSDYQPLIDRIGELRHKIEYDDGDHVSGGSMDNAVTALNNGDPAEAERQLRFVAARRRASGFKSDAASLDLLADAAHDASQGKPLSNLPAQPVDIDQVWHSLDNLASDADLIDAGPVVIGLIHNAQDDLHSGTHAGYDSAAKALDQAQRLALGANFNGLANGIGAQARLIRKADPAKAVASPGPAAQKFLREQAAPALQKILGGKQNWNGQVTLVSQADWPFTYGEMTWGRQMRLREDIAQQFKDDADHPNNPIRDPHAYDVMLHELIHGVSSDPSHMDMDAYQDERVANLEEGFTELGATQHMAEFADAVGIGHRDTIGFAPGMKAHYKITPDERHQLSTAFNHAYNNLLASPATLNDLDHASTAIDKGDLDTAAGLVSAALSKEKNQDQRVALFQLREQLDDLGAKYMGTARATVDEVAQARYTTRQIRADDGPWGHYPWQTAAAYAWVQKIAHEEGLKGAAAAKRMVELADEINREGSYSKSRIMAQQVARTVKGLTPAKMTDTEWESIIANIEEGFSPASVVTGNAGLDPVENAKFRAKIIAQKQQEREKAGA